MTRAGPSISIAIGTAWKECTPRVATLSLCLRPHVVDLLHSAVFQEAATNLTFPKKPSKQIEFPNQMGVCLFLPGPRLWFPPCMSCLWTHSYYNLCSLLSYLLFVFVAYRRSHWWWWCLSFLLCPQYSSIQYAHSFTRTAQHVCIWNTCAGWNIRHAKNASWDDK